jgi:gamma-glutamyltranspeptidase
MSFTAQVAPLPGQVMQFPDLAETFRTLAKEGTSGFYHGRVAEVSKGVAVPADTDIC